MENLFSPDHSTCLNCKKPITWDDWSYIHDDTGFADCGIALDLRPLDGRVSSVEEIHQFKRFEGAVAHPIERILGYV